jgi:hypothetical protein
MNMLNKKVNNIYSVRGEKMGKEVEKEYKELPNNSFNTEITLKELEMALNIEIIKKQSFMIKKNC